MGFRELEKDFRKYEAEVGNDPSFDFKNRMWFLRLLFEINGNLDTIAVVLREYAKKDGVFNVEQSNKGAKK